MNTPNVPNMQQLGLDDFELRRRIITNLLAATIREINKIQNPQERAYFEPLLADATKHLDDIRMQLLREGKIRLYA
jgi:hypothetical protein